MLPLIRSVAAEITERRTERRRLARQREELSRERTPEGLGSAIGNLDSAIFGLEEGIQQASGELGDMGLTVLRHVPLTIHFPGQTRGGELVFCWQEGEESVSHGHPVGEEEDPRRPLKLRLGD